MTLETFIPCKARIGIAALTLAAAVMPLPAIADAFVFSTGTPDGLIATAARPDSPGKFEIETGDDFVLTQQTLITGAAFTGLIPLGASASDIKNVVVEVYRVFPADSDLGRTRPDISIRSRFKEVGHRSRRPHRAIGPPFGSVSSFGA
jgi:hypothetical protein